jgi:polyketide cyclase/dehydrase/lipid transport protein
VIGITASEERVWAALTDVENWPEWTSSMTSVTRIDGGVFCVGSQARIKQPRLGTMTWTVTELTPRQSFVWEAKRPGLTLVAGHYISSAGAETVNLKLTVEQKGPVGRRPPEPSGTHSLGRAGLPIDHWRGATPPSARAEVGLVLLDTLAACLGVGEPALQDRFGSTTPTRPKPGRRSCASRPANLALGSCGAWASGVRSVSADRMRRHDTRTSTLSAGLRESDLASKRTTESRSTWVRSSPVKAHSDLRRSASQSAARS